MDYLRTLGTAAVSTLVQKSGLNLPFSLGPKVPQADGYYNLYDATKRVGYHLSLLLLLNVLMIV
jgi:SCY1-like protein 1